MTRRDILRPTSLRSKMGLLLAAIVAGAVVTFGLVAYRAVQS